MFNCNLDAKKQTRTTDDMVYYKGGMNYQTTGKCHRNVMNGAGMFVGIQRGSRWVGVIKQVFLSQSGNLMEHLGFGCLKLKKSKQNSL